MFESPNIKINTLGIDLIKNYQVEDHIDFKEVKQINLIKSNLHRYWMVYLLSGLVILTACAVWGIYSAITYHPPSQHLINPEAYIAYHLFSPWILFIGGGIWTYQAFRKGPVLMIQTHTNSYRTVIKEIEKIGTLSNLIHFLDNRVNFTNEYKSL